MAVKYVGGQAFCNFHGMVQCYENMLHIAVMLYSNLLHLVTSSRAALVMRRSLQQFYVIVLHYMSVPTLPVSFMGYVTTELIY